MLGNLLANIVFPEPGGPRNKRCERVSESRIISLRISGSSFSSNTTAMLS